MTTKKRWYFVWMLVFVLLVFVGCGKNQEGPKDSESVAKNPESVAKDGQKDYVEKSLKEIVKKMKSDGPRAKSKKIKRSLAKHILKDHVTLMAYFQSGQFDQMKNNLGNAQVKIEGSDNWEDIDADFWRDLYEAKKKTCEDLGYKNFSIELEIYADDISLKDIDDIPSTEEKENCESREKFFFKIIAYDENGNVISNQDREGRRDRKHSQGCPWG